MLSFASYSHSYIYHSGYRWESLLFAKAWTILLPSVYRTLSYLFALKPAPCGSHSLNQSVLESVCHFVKNKLGHGARIHRHLFSIYRSRLELRRVPLSWWGFVSYPLSFPYGKLSATPDISDKEQVFIDYVYIISKIFWKVKKFLCICDWKLQPLETVPAVLLGTASWTQTSDLAGHIKSTYLQRTSFAT